MTLWDTFASRLEITARLVCRTGVRVGRGGEAAEPTATDLPVMTDDTGLPFLPGSSLRGVLRAHVERLVRSLEPDPGGGRGACNPVVEQEWCVTGDRIRGWREEQRRARRQEGAPEKADARFAQQVWQRSCRVCRVFGSPWLASRVRVADLPCVAGGAVERRDGVSIDRDKETVANKYDFEAVPAGTAFRLGLVAENLGQAERGLLWLGLRELQEGRLALGGFKGRGLGQVALDSFHMRGVEATDRAALKRYVLWDELTEVDAAEAGRWLEALWRELEGGASDAPIVSQ
jgi:CRISPR-associated RAMP protein (TIGR02581 family)